MNNVDVIHDYLVKGGTLSVNKARVIFGTTELRHYISILRKRGVDVKKERVDHIFDNGWHNEYWIDNQEVKDVK